MTYWQGKKTVVTGGAGMVGLQLVNLLIDAGADVVVLDNFSRGKNKLLGAMYLYGDAGNEGACCDAFKDAEVVFNLAAVVAGVDFNQSHHAHMFEHNLRLQSMPLRIAAEYGVEKFLQTSSVCVYPPEYNNPAIEDNGLLGEPIQANIGYSFSKRMGEYLAGWYAGSTDMETVVVRPSNCYGLHDYFDEKAHVIPALIKKCLADDEIVVNGTGMEKREFIYSTDLAKGMMAVMEAGHSGEAYNLGTNGETCITIGELLNKIQYYTNTDSKPVKWTDLFDGGDNIRRSDCTKAELELGWKYETDMDDGLQNVIEWYMQEGI
jgi:nucleoside-diphosphate-sugar epimerase